MNYSEALLTGNGLTLGEALSMGGQTTAIGLGIVFGVLLVLMLVLVLFKVIFYKDPSKQKKVAATEVNAPVVNETIEVKDETDEEELIAILTAAVAASLNTSTYNLQIKSYRRVEDRRPSWNKAGLRETISNRF